MVARHRPGAGLWRASIWSWGTLLSATAGCGGAQLEAQSAEPDTSSAEEAPFDDGADSEVTGSSGDDDTSGEAPKTKSSVEPVDITVKYTRSQITACGLVAEEGAKSCQATENVDRSGSATVLLVPIDAEEEVDPSRSEQTLEFADSAATQEQAVALEPGFWELEWKGDSTVRQRFEVVPRESFEIVLEGVAGMCAMDGGKCKLQGAKVQQSVELPEAREMN